MILSEAGKRDKVVIGVDDHASNIAVLTTLIEAHGYTFFGVSSGRECISLAQRISPRLILLDIQMPDMDGFETCRRLRAIWLLKQTPIVFVTGRKSSEDVRTGLAAGGDDFIIKPFDPEQLLTRVDHWTCHRPRSCRQGKPMPAGVAVGAAKRTG